MEQNSEKGVTPEEAIEMWIKHLEATLFKGISEQDVEKLMAPVSRDKAWIYLGGSGKRSQIYMIDSYLQIRFDFNYQDFLESYTVNLSRKGWLKGPGGILLEGFDASDARLTVL